MARRTKLIWYKGNWYHPSFFKRGPLAIKRANSTCRHCGKRRGEEYTAKTGRIDKAVIQAAHVNHDPENPHAELIALCKQCHMRYDGLLHGRNGRRTRLCKKREAMIQAGQLELPLQFKQEKRKRRLAWTNRQIASDVEVAGTKDTLAGTRLRTFPSHITVLRGGQAPAKSV